MDTSKLGRQQASDEDVKLHRYKRDLIALSTLSALWVGHPPRAIIRRRH
jgi:hypothetical protein